MRRGLRASAHILETFRYSAFEPYDSIVQRLVVRLEEVARRGEYVAVGHSLGGVLLRSAIPRLQGKEPRHLVMLGSPSRAPRLARKLCGFPPFRWLTRECGSRLADPSFFESLPLPTVPYTIVAGTRGFPGTLSPFGDEPNDGIVAVEETRIHDDDQPVLVRILHAFLPGNARVHDVILRVLAGDIPRTPSSPSGAQTARE
jgi:hypothetical protein